MIFWIVFGALAGWIASLIAGTNQRQGCLMNIVVGVVGSFIGGALYSLITGTDFGFGFNITSMIVAVIGSVLLLAIFKMIRR